jgi:hypothetical protein
MAMVFLLNQFHCETQKREMGSGERGELVSGRERGRDGPGTPLSRKSLIRKYVKFRHGTFTKTSSRARFILHGQGLTAASRYKSP